MPETILAEPRANAILETFRSIGYSVEVAIADIVDNSISAGAKNISITFHWDGPNSWLTIADDGQGMIDSEIVEAMRPGSHHPLSERSPNDLGRFGLGLKTASFSQCRRLTAISRKPGQEPAYWCWDLDHVAQTNRWELIRQLAKPELVNDCRRLPGGTIIVWECLDRLTANTKVDNHKHHDNFLKSAAIVKEHLAMVFHRFLESGKIKLSINTNPILPWDPYMHGQPGLQSLPEEPLSGGKVLIKGFVLPHISKISTSVHHAGAGPRGWNEQQGFYIYRNERLLVAGSWLGLYSKEEHYKLARIRVDISNQLDTEWQIDIKKSIARPPATLRDELRRIADNVRRQAVDIYRHRGKVLQRSLRQAFVPVWQEKVRNNKRFYTINRDHPTVKNTLAGNIPLDSLLRLLEETVPVPLIALSESRQPDSQPVPFDNAQAELQKAMRLVFDSLRQTMSDEAARQCLLLTEPFTDYPHLLEQL